MGKTNVYDKIMIENQKKRENMKIKFFYKNLYLEDCLQMEFAACYSELMPERTLTSFTLYVTHIASYWRKKVGDAQNI